MPISAMGSYRQLHIETTEIGDTVHLRVKDSLGTRSDLAALRKAIEASLALGKNNIALSLTRDSVLYTQAIAILVQCIDMIHQQGGRLTLIAPGQEIVEVLETMSLDMLVAIVGSESDLPAA